MWRLVTETPIVGRERTTLSLPASEVYLLRVVCPTAKTTWTKAGYGRLLTTVEGVDHVSGSCTVGFSNGGLLVGTDFNSFRLRFDPVPWLPPATLTVRALERNPIAVYVPSPP